MHYSPDFCGAVKALVAHSFTTPIRYSFDQSYEDLTPQTGGINYDAVWVRVTFDRVTDDNVEALAAPFDMRDTVTHGGRTAYWGQLTKLSYSPGKPGHIYGVAIVGHA